MDEVIGRVLRWIKHCPCCGKPPIVQDSGGGQYLCVCSDAENCDCEAFVVYDNTADPESYVSLDGDPL